LQPVAALATGLVVGYEALARFPGSPHPSPAMMFAQATAAGLGPELEAAAIRAALELPGRPPGTFLALNTSPSALTTGPVRESLSGPLEGVVIEITEHESIPDDSAAFSAAIAALRSRGARIAIDDAGAGYAGLRQLMRLRPDILKLDIELVKNIHRDPARAALVESLVRYARKIGAVVCAEGIENLDELARVADLDVEWGQGYVLAGPQPGWSGIAGVAADVCRSALERALRDPGDGVGDRDERLVRLSGALAGSRSRADLDGALAMISAELNAHSVCLSRIVEGGGAVETLADNGDNDDQGHYNLADYPTTARVLNEQEVVQVTVGDPRSDRREADLLLAQGHSSMLMVPVVARRQTLGTIEVFRRGNEAWTRAEINRARVIANQFASVIHSLDGTPADRL
nr:EAL domain-containing protein [Solirubrobacterales bacterium]